MKAAFKVVVSFLCCLASGCSTTPVIVATENRSLHANEITCPEGAKSIDVIFEVDEAVPNEIMSTPKGNRAYSKVIVQGTRALLDSVGVEVTKKCFSEKSIQGKTFKFVIAKVDFIHGEVPQGTGHEQPVVDVKMEVQIHDKHNNIMRENVYEGRGRGELYWILTASKHEINKRYTEAAQKALVSALIKTTADSLRN